VGCAECHGLKARKAHADTFDHNGYDIHVVVSPDDCAHLPRHRGANSIPGNIMAHGRRRICRLTTRLYNRACSAYHPGHGSQIKNGPDWNFDTGRRHDTRAEACYYCHGTHVEGDRQRAPRHRCRRTGISGYRRLAQPGGGPRQPGRQQGAPVRPATRATRFSIEVARKPLHLQGVPRRAGCAGLQSLFRQQARQHLFIHECRSGSSIRYRGSSVTRHSRRRPAPPATSAWW
jgi:hydroxylamine dehydrogenase